MRFLNKEQINQAVIRAYEKGEREGLMIEILANTGLRVSELINLEPQNINISERILYVKGKGGKIRNVDITPRLAINIDRYIKSHKIGNRKKLFPITRQRVWQLTKEIANANPHAFRHSFAIELLRKTGNIRYVQIQLGHTTLGITQVYLRYMEFSQEKNKLNQLYQ